MSTVKLIGTIGWMIQEGYPELSGEDGAETITEKYIVDKAAIGDIPAVNSAYSNADHPFLNTFTLHKLRQRNVRAMKGDVTYEATLVWSLPPGVDPPGEMEVFKTSEYSTMEFDAPIGQHPNYLMCWDHHLATDGESETPNLDYDTLMTVNTPDMPADMQTHWRWIKNPESLPDGFYIVEPRTKPGVDSYRTGAAVVTETYRSTSQGLLTKRIQDDFHIGAPEKTFGASGQWLRGGSGMTKQGAYWLQRVAWTNRAEWDSEIYGEA